MKLMKETIIWDDSVGLFYLNIAHRLNNKISHLDIRHWGFPCPENTRTLDFEVESEARQIFSYSLLEENVLVMFFLHTVTDFHRKNVPCKHDLDIVCKMFGKPTLWSPMKFMLLKFCLDCQLTKLFVIVIVKSIVSFYDSLLWSRLYFHDGFE